MSADCPRLAQTDLHGVLTGICGSIQGLQPALWSLLQRLVMVEGFPPRLLHGQLLRYVYARRWHDRRAQIGSAHSWHFSRRGIFARLSQ